MKHLDDELPNGFHDGVLRRLAVDYDASTLSLEIEFWIGDLQSDQRETYRLGRVTVTGLELLAIDPPAYGSGPQWEDLSIDGAEGHPSTHVLPAPKLPEGTFLFWLFVYKWNSFIRFAGRDVTLEWMGEPIDRDYRP